LTIFNFKIEEYLMKIIICSVKLKIYKILLNLRIEIVFIRNPLDSQKSNSYNKKLNLNRIQINNYKTLLFYWNNKLDQVKTFFF
jgi:hypothetical protein